MRPVDFGSTALALKSMVGMRFWRIKTANLYCSWSIYYSGGGGSTFNAINLN